MKKIIALSLVLPIFCVALSGCFLLPVTQREKEKIIKHYDEQSDYLWGNAYYLEHYYSADVVYLKLVYSYLDDNETRWTICDFCVMPKAAEQLKTLGIFEKAEEGARLSVALNCYIIWDGWQPFVAALSFNDEVFIDFESGQAEILDYIQNL